MIKSPNLNNELIDRSTLADQLHGTQDTVEYNNQSWKKVSSKVNWVKNPNSLWVSLGSAVERERLFFDENSSTVTKLKQKILTSCAGKSIENALNIINSLINELTHVEGKSIFAVETNLDGELDLFLSLVHEKKPGKFIDVHFETLVKNKLLVCRHKALLAASLLAHLVENKILPQGIVRQYRSELAYEHGIGGAHTWATYRDLTTGHLWICDPRNRLVYNMATKYDHAVKALGKTTLEVMVKRLDVEDKQVTQAEEPKTNPKMELEAPKNETIYSKFGKKLNSNKNYFRLAEEVEFDEKSMIISLNDLISFHAFCDALNQQNIHFDIHYPSIHILDEKNPYFNQFNIDNFANDFFHFVFKNNDNNNANQKAEIEPVQIAKPQISTRSWELRGYEIQNSRGVKLCEFALDQSVIMEQKDSNIKRSRP